MDSVQRLARVLALVPMFALAGPVPAQNAGAQSTPPMSAAELALLDTRATDLIGAEVQSPTGEQLGQIEDLILDVANAQVRYAVVAYGGKLGYGTRMAAFPPVLFRPAPEEGELVLNVTPEQFREAPSFEANAWPDWLGASYPDEVDRFFLQDEQVVKEPGGAHLIRTADVVGRDVNDGGSRSAGSIEDVVVNLGNGQIRYVVLDYASRLGFDRRLVPLPMNAFRFPSRPDLNAFLTIDRERVTNARAFDPDDWPDLSDARQRSEIDASLSQFGTPEQTEQRETTGGQDKTPEAAGER